MKKGEKKGRERGGGWKGGREKEGEREREVGGKWEDRGSKNREKYQFMTDTTY